MPHDVGATSARLRTRLESLYGDQVPGCVFHVRRNGELFADGSFGWARLPGSPDGQAPMTADSLVHTGSIGKFICAVGILRLMQVWNTTYDTLGPQLRPSFLRDRVTQHGARIDLDTTVYTLVAGFVDQTLIAGYGIPQKAYPGAGVSDLTLRQLLQHTSGFTQNYDESDLGTLTAKNDVDYQPPDDGPTRYDLKKVVTALLRKSVSKTATGYNNPAYTVLGAVIEASTGVSYEKWIRQHVFHSEFDDVSRKPVDNARAARYYYRGASSFMYGNRHPDYTNFSAAGGWYMSATQFCAWVEAVMQKTPLPTSPILNDPQLLLDLSLGFDGTFQIGRLRGCAKGGSASPGGGNTNAGFAFLRGYGDERVCAFTQANANINAGQLLEEGLRGLRDVLTKRPGPVPALPASTGGLLQAAYWNDAAGAVKSASRVIAVQTRSTNIDNITADRTDLFGDTTVANARKANEIGMVELRGMLRMPDTGTYRFRLSSDDGSILWIDDELLVDNDGGHGPRAVESADFMFLGGGSYPIRVQWYNGASTGCLYLEWKTPGSTNFQAIPAAHFSVTG